ncbi:hypothetical protein O181_004721 [Austropuccinia psidii MF-1]|uniref:Uncharacterized protein n=1 Tax=Austropuccinia psidii MF-1 TaxID=1389203 RepID=A0A9Q3BHH3_9BASI|nr:hypothetical protein [Austropuccinia psidii MF-1]
MIVLNLSELSSHPASIVRRGGFLVLNLLLLGPPGANSENLGKEISLRPAIGSQTIPEYYGAASRRVEDLDWKLLLMNLQPLMPPLATPIVFNICVIPTVPGPTLEDPFPPRQPHWSSPRKDGKIGKLKRNLVVQDEVDTDAEGSSEIEEEELAITTPIQKRRIHSTSPSPVQASTTIHGVIKSSKPPQLPIRSPTRPFTLASTSTNVQLPMASTSRDPLSPEPESIFDHC